MQGAERLTPLAHTAKASTEDRAHSRHEPARSAFNAGEFILAKRNEMDELGTT
jgi:hypothetical protein